MPKKSEKKDEQAQEVSLPSQDEIKEFMSKFPACVFSYVDADGSVATEFRGRLSAICFISTCIQAHLMGDLQSEQKQQ